MNITTTKMDNVFVNPTFSSQGFVITTAGESGTITLTTTEENSVVIIFIDNTTYTGGGDLDIEIEAGDVYPEQSISGEDLKVYQGTTGGIVLKNEKINGFDGVFSIVVTPPQNKALATMGVGAFAIEIPFAETQKKK